MRQTTRPRALVVTVCSLLGALWTATAAAADAEPSPEDSALGTHQRHVRLDLGIRTQFINSAAFDPFSENDVLNHFTSSASATVLTRGKLSLAGVVGFDYGATSARARSDSASLGVTRFVLAPEARFHVLRVVALTARIGPTLSRQSATLTGADAELSKTAWRFGADATVGAAVELFGYASGASHKPRLWVTGEGGYCWTASNQLKLEPTRSNAAPLRSVPVELGDLSLSGPLLRITAALSFW